MTFKEKKEFETINERIEKLETDISDTESQMSGITSDYVKLQELFGQKNPPLKPSLRKRWTDGSI